MWPKGTGHRHASLLECLNWITTALLARSFYDQIRDAGMKGAVGSVAERTVRLASCPVMTVKAAD